MVYITLLKHKFCYASAGHEPGFYYDAKNGQFTDLDGKGLLLGIDKKTKYEEYETDSHAWRYDYSSYLMVLQNAERRKGLLKEKILLDLIKRHIHLPAQEIVTNVYKDLERLQDFVSAR